MPVSASVLAWRAAICAAIAIWGVTWVPEARRAATLSTVWVGVGAAAVTALHSNGVGTEGGRERKQQLRMRTSWSLVLCS